MRRFKVHHFVHEAKRLCILEDKLRTQTGTLDEKSRGTITAYVAKVTDLCRNTGILEASVQYGELTIKWLCANRPYSAVAQRIGNFRDRLQEELERRYFISLSHNELANFENPHIGWERVIERFPKITCDLEEGRKCLALGRNTASVFHCMRIVEVGLRSLGKSLNDPSLNPESNPNWDRILSRCDRELQKQLKDRSSEWRQYPVFYSQATANLRAVKDAWRNPTLHIEVWYDDEGALDVLNAVKAFMRHLATKLDGF